MRQAKDSVGVRTACVIGRAAVPIAPPPILTCSSVAGASVTARDVNGHTPLDLAISRGRMDFADPLLQPRCDVSILF